MDWRAEIDVASGRISPHVRQWRAERDIVAGGNEVPEPKPIPKSDPKSDPMSDPGVGDA